MRVVVHKSKQNLYKQFLSVNLLISYTANVTFGVLCAAKTKRWKRRVSLVLMKPSRTLVFDGIWLSGARVFFVV